MATSHTPDSLIREFISLLVSRDLESAAAMVTNDFEYDNVPMGKTFGPQGLRDTLNGFFSMCTGIDWKILRQTSSGTLDSGIVLIFGRTFGFNNGVERIDNVALTIHYDCC